MKSFSKVNLKESGFFRKLLDFEAMETSDKSSNQNMESSIVHNTSNIVFLNHLSPNRNFHLYQEGSFGAPLASSSFKTQDYEINIKNKAILKLQKHFTEYLKELENALKYLNTMEVYAKENKEKIQEAKMQRNVTLHIRKKTLFGIRNLVNLSTFSKYSNQN